MKEVVAIAQCPKQCVNAKCDERNKLLRSVRWQQVAPMWCTYGYDVIAQIGWQRQMQRQIFREVRHNCADKRADQRNTSAGDLQLSVFTIAGMS